MQTKTSRRTFVKGLTAGGILGGLGLWRAPVWAVTSPGQPNVLTGTEFDLFMFSDAPIVERLHFHRTLTSKGA